MKILSGNFFAKLRKMMYGYNTLLAVLWFVVQELRTNTPGKEMQQCRLVNVLCKAFNVFGLVVCGGALFLFADIFFL